MTTIERAKRFWAALDKWWQDDSQDSVAQLCQSSVARALIRQKVRRARRVSMTNLMNRYDGGYLDGLSDALEILDAVYGGYYDPR